MSDFSDILAASNMKLVVVESGYGMWRILEHDGVLRNYELS